MRPSSSSSKALLPLLLLAVLKVGYANSVLCEENLQVLVSACTRDDLERCCSKLSTRTSQECINDGSYNSLLSSSLGKVLFQILGQCPKRGGGEAGTTSVGSQPPWIFPACLEDGTAEVIWDLENSEPAERSLLSVVLERWNGEELRQAELASWDFIHNNTTIAKYVDKSASCATKAEAVSYRLKVFLKGTLVATTSRETVKDAALHRFVSSSFFGEGEAEGCGSWSQPCSTLKHVLENIPQEPQNHVSVVILPGIYEGASNVALHIENASLAITSAAGSAETTLACAGGLHGLMLTNSNVSLSRLTIKDCSSITGGAINAAGSVVRLSDLILKKNTASGDGAVGGAMSFRGCSEVTIRNSRVFENKASKYGAGIYIHSSNVIVTGTEIHSNVLVGAGRGAGISIFANSSVQINNSSIYLNEGYFAGGIMLENSSLSLLQSKLKNNTANYGGAFVFVSASAIISGSILEGNEAAQYGGALLLESAGIEIHESTFRSNKARDGGALYSSNSSVFSSTSRLNITNSLIEDNYAGIGGAFMLKSVDADFQSVEVRHNSAEEGGGLFCENSKVSVRKSRIQQNRALLMGGGVRMKGSCIALFSGSLIVGNTAAGGGGIHSSAQSPLDGKSVLHVVNSTFSDNVADAGGAILGIGNASFLTVENTLVHSNRALEGGGFMLTNDSSLYSRNSAFTENKAHIGGASSLVGSSCQILNSTFAKGKSHKGAAINVLANLDFFQVDLEDLSFYDNIALDGSSIYWSKKASPRKDLICVNCTHTQEREGSSSSIATEAIKLGFLSPLTHLVHSTEEIPTFQVGLLDLYSQISQTSSKHLCQISTKLAAANYEDDLLIYKEGQQESINGTATYSGLRVEGKIGMKYQLQVECFSAVSVKQLVLYVNITISECKPGQEPRQDLRNCMDCRYGYYNFDGARCKPCPEGGVCPGKSLLLSQNGWWRPTNLSEKLYMCPKTQACEAGERTGDESCIEGHRGPVCALCSISFHEWGNYCRKCSQISTYVFPAIAAIAILFLVTVVLNTAWDPAQTDSIVRVNILVSYCQILGRLNYYGIGWTKTMSSALGLLDYSNIGAKLTAPRCIESQTTFYETYLFVMSLPLLILLSYFLWYVVRAAYIKRGKHLSRDPSLRLIETKTFCCRSVLWLLTLVYVSVGSMSFEVFGTRLIENKHFLQSDYNIVVKEYSGAYSRIHRTMIGVGIFFLLIYPFGIPLFAFMLLKYCRTTPSYEDAVAFLNCGYADRYYYWEVLEMMRNLLISIVPTVFPQNTALQNTISQTVLVTYLVGLLLIQPYKKKSNLFLQCLQLFTVWMLISGGVLLKYGNLGEDTQTSISTLLIFWMVTTFLIIACNCLNMKRETRVTPNI